MKKILSMLAILFAICFAASAQDKSFNKLQNQNDKHALKEGKKDRKKMMKELGLSKQQKMQMKQFTKSNKTRKAAIQNNQGLTPQQKKEQMMDLRKDQQEKMNSILTPEQKQKMKERILANRNNSTNR